MNAISEIIGNPKFKIGEYVIHRSEAEGLNDGVVWFTLYGVILGISYCADDCGEYIGWLYDVLLTHEKQEFENKSYMHSYSSTKIYENIPESEISLCDEDLEPVNTIIENRQKQILNNYRSDLELTNIKKLKF